MDRKPNMGTGTLKLLGLIFLPMGLLFVGLGIFIPMVVADPEIHILRLVYCTLGSWFALLGAAFLVAEAAKKRQFQRLLEGNRYIWGKVVDVQTNYNVRIGRRSPRIAVVRYQDAAGQAHLFRSQGMMQLIPEDVLGRQVKIYIENERYKPYYVDLAPLLPNYIEH